ncbi:phage portal protein [Gordonia malaquae]|uniref:phage portal protein n=1 Tax=Gordonia malaquae TaxID=410332 RepID=UPI003017D7A6
MQVWPSSWRIRRTRVESLPDSEALLTALDPDAIAQSPADMYESQPHLRTVVSFLARNVAHLGLHVYRRDENGSRKRVRDHALARLLARPNPHTTTFEFVQAIVSNLALFDRALIWVTPDNTDTPAELRVITESWIVDTVDSTPFAVGSYVLSPDGKNRVTVPASDVIELHGWNAGDCRTGTSPVVALRAVLAEQIQAQVYRGQLWSNGGRIGAYLTRPKDAPEWGNVGRKRFKEQWKAAYTGTGKKVGGVPLLEDGMELKRLGFSAKEEDYVEGTKLALTTVAAVYHVNPTMLGLLDNANYSNVREFRSMLYVDTLGPLIAMIEARLNAYLIDRFADSDGLYVEFNISEKLEGSFEDQNQQLSTALASGYMTVNEVRQRLNLPALPDGDVLARPLNTEWIDGNSEEETE